MGLNPPFGVRASLANKFIDHALQFRPKLLILIVPEETRRLDHKKNPYDLIWQEQDMLSGKSFYLPGSVDRLDQPLDDWNINPPRLSLWSRPDWTAKHIVVAKRRGHIERKQNKPYQGAERVVSNYLMEEKHDCFGDFSNVMTKYQDISTILDDVPEEPNCDDVADMDISSPVISSTNSKYEPTLNPPCIQSSHSGHHPGFGPPQPHTSASYGPYAPDDFASTSVYPNYGYPTYPHNSSVNPHGPTFYGQPDFTSEANVWPPGTTPPHFRYN